ncbi:M48 family metalloprotease [Streptomyces sp. NPDC055189]
MAPPHPTDPGRPEPPPGYPEPAYPEPSYPEPAPAPFCPASAYPEPAYPDPAQPDPAPTYPDPAPTYPDPYPNPAAAHPIAEPPPLPPEPRPSAARPPEPHRAADDLDYRHQGARLHVAAHQRGADATAVGSLLAQVPGFLVSSFVVSGLSVGLLGALGWLVVLAWLASGALVFHRPTELAFARHALGLRQPLAEERTRLEPVWQEVTARAGIEPQSYELMVESSGELNALAAAGHVVSVTTYSLNQLPSSRLAAVLAHELGHHTGGHAWAGLLGQWYSMPGRVVWAVARRIARITFFVARRISPVATGLVFLVLGGFLLSVAATLWFILVPLIVTPYLLAHFGRRGELRADQQAAALGFAPMLADILRQTQLQEDTDRARAVAAGYGFKQPGRTARLLSSHPETHTRLLALEPYLRTHL